MTARERRGSCPGASPCRRSSMAALASRSVASMREEVRVRIDMVQLEWLAPLWSTHSTRREVRLRTPAPRSRAPTQQGAVAEDISIAVASARTGNIGAVARGSGRTSEAPALGIRTLVARPRSTRFARSARAVSSDENRPSRERASLRSCAAAPLDRRLLEVTGMNALLGALTLWGCSSSHPEAHSTAIQGELELDATTPSRSCCRRRRRFRA